MSDALARRIAETLHAREGTARAWGLKFEDAGEGWARCSLIVRPDMLNGHDVAHGGMIFALADTSFAWACNSRNVKSLAQHAAITFLSPVTAGEKLIAEAHEQALAGRSGVYAVKVTADDGRTVAIFEGLSRAVGGGAVD